VVEEGEAELAESLGDEVEMGCVSKGEEIRGGSELGRSKEGVHESSFDDLDGDFCEDKGEKEGEVSSQYGRAYDGRRELESSLISPPPARFSPQQCLPEQRRIILTG